VPFRDACGKDAKLNLELAAMDGFPQRNSRVKEDTQKKRTGWMAEGAAEGLGLNPRA